MSSPHPAVRFWTVEEARAYLPQLRELVEQIKQAADAHAHVSRFKGRMHGCGHDGHTTMLLGAAAYLSRVRNFDGVVYLICWRLGEDDIEWWHLPDAGFAGRRRLPRDPS